MKKILVAIILFVSMVNYGQEIKGGVKAGFNFSTFSDDVDNDSSGGIGYGVGYYETMEINSKFDLQGEINYTKYVYETNNNVKNNMNFVEIPLMCKYKFDNLAIGLGYQFGFGLGGESVQEFGGVESTTELESSNDNGLLIDVSTKSKNFTFGLRYYMGSKKIYDGNTINSINFSVGYKLL
jgi:hypothetical protein